MSKVFVVDTMYKPLEPIHSGWARKLLTSGKAAVFRRYPFTIILNEEVANPEVQPLRLKLDPGSKTTGIAIVNDASGGVVFAAELSHRGHAIKDALDGRRGVRRSRRQRKTRYRFSRWQKHPNNIRNSHPEGWLAPSIESRLFNVETWVKRIIRYCPIGAISQEHVRFDMQHMDNPEISGVEYQQGELQGYEVKEYLLEKWHRQCAYCGAKDIPLQVEHIQARANGGTDRVSNLTLACEPCNRKKGKQDIQVFLKNKPDVLKRILAQAKTPLKDAAAVNMTRWALYERLKVFGLPIECGSGGRTKFNRTQRNLAKTTHWLDAACVGTSTPDALIVRGVKPLLIEAKGHGHRHVLRVDGYGFPEKKGKDERPLSLTGRLSGKGSPDGDKRFRTYKKEKGKLVFRPIRRIGPDTREAIKPRKRKRYQGFQTGDIVKASIPKGRNAGVHIGCMTMQSDGNFYFGSGKDRISFSWKYCTAIHRNDGYNYKY